MPLEKRTPESLAQMNPFVLANNMENDRREWPLVACPVMAMAEVKMDPGAFALMERRRDLADAEQMMVVDEG